ncbi:MAG: ferritin family protein [Candidatus Thorarchaeota archaeon]|nr:ferritin family protein [Candidatus Thorarchaeota archaeon]
MTNVQKTFERLVSLAIQREEEAYEFYMKAAEESEFKASAKLLQDLANQEVTHKEKLQTALKAGVCETFSCETKKELDDMDLNQYLIDIPLLPSSTPQDVLIVAIKKESSAHSFYKALSELTGSGQHRTVFETLAKEEESHKNRLQHMYDDIFQPDM